MKTKDYTSLKITATFEVDGKEFTLNVEPDEPEKRNSEYLIVAFKELQRQVDLIEKEVTSNKL